MNVITLRPDTFTLNFNVTLSVPQRLHQHPQPPRRYHPGRVPGCENYAYTGGQPGRDGDARGEGRGVEQDVDDMVVLPQHGPASQPVRRAVCCMCVCVCVCVCVHLSDSNTLPAPPIRPALPFPLRYTANTALGFPFCLSV